jgi:soluble lytic murein transglycosylase-like protein
MATATAHTVTLPESQQLAVIKAAAARWHIDWHTLLGVYGTESGYGKNEGPSSAGALGPFQFEPATAKHYGLTNPWDFTTSTNAAARYLHDLGADGNINSDKTKKALNAYSGGGGDSYVTKVRTLSEGLHAAINPNDPFNPSAPVDATVGAAKKAAGAIEDAAQVPGKFLNLLTNPQTWLRLVEILIGVALLLMGLKSFTGGAIDPVGVVAHGAARAV